MWILFLKANLQQGTQIAKFLTYTNSFAGCRQYVHDPSEERHLVFQEQEIIQRTMSLVCEDCWPL